MGRSMVVGANVAVMIFFAMTAGIFSTALCASQVQAAELDYVNVHNKSKRFFVTSRAIVHAPLNEVYATLIDFDEYEKFSSIYTDARWLTRNADDSGEIYTYTRGCIAFFCKGLERVETVIVKPQTFIETRVDPTRSDARHGVSTWRLTGLGNTTVIEFDMEFEPSFWMPPLIGPYLVKRRLKQGGEDAITRIEVLAKERIAR
ncbi:MAG: SRPBCC family protein [Gammaproteobacteria bacterium]|nr:SRPBCC family protein [Gammaproteobacteria bacterium]